MSGHWSAPSGYRTSYEYNGYQQQSYDSLRYHTASSKAGFTEKLLSDKLARNGCCSVRCSRSSSNLRQLRNSVAGSSFKRRWHMRMYRWLREMNKCINERVSGNNNASTSIADVSTNQLGNENIYVNFDPSQKGKDTTNMDIFGESHLLVELYHSLAG